MKRNSKTNMIKQAFIERFSESPLLIKPSGRLDGWQHFDVTGGRHKAIMAIKPYLGTYQTCTFMIIR